VSRRLDHVAAAPRHARAMIVLCQTARAAPGPPISYMHLLTLHIWLQATHGPVDCA